MRSSFFASILPAPHSVGSPPPSNLQPQSPAESAPHSSLPRSATQNPDPIGRFLRLSGPLAATSKSTDAVGPLWQRYVPLLKAYSTLSASSHTSVVSSASPSPSMSSDSVHSRSRVVMP